MPRGRDIAALPFRRVLGPYDVFNFVGPRCLPLVLIPYTEVQAGQIAITVVTSETIYDANLAPVVFVEIEIAGIVQGMSTTLRRQWMRQSTGPLLHTFDDSDAFENVQILARNMSGGNRSSSTGTTAVVNVAIQPRIV